MAGKGGQNNTIKIAVAIVALIAAVALPAWYFLGNKSLPPTPPATNNPPPTPEQQQQIEEMRQRPPVPTEEGSA